MPSYNWIHNSPQRYIPPPYSVTPSYPIDTSRQKENTDLFSIPLPNEKEASAEVVNLPVDNSVGISDNADAVKKPRQSSKTAQSRDNRRSLPSVSGIFHYIQQHITLEDIILVGLIIIMLDESIDDDILLIILIYILLF